MEREDRRDADAVDRRGGRDGAPDGLGATTLELTLDVAAGTHHLRGNLPQAFVHAPLLECAARG
jgi:hypothetical protein